MYFWFVRSLIPYPLPLSTELLKINEQVFTHCACVLSLCYNPRPSPSPSPRPRLRPAQIRLFHLPQVDGNRRRSVVGKGLVIPCVYVFRGKQKYFDRLISVFAKLEVPSHNRMTSKQAFLKATTIYKRFLFVLIVS